MSSALVYDRQRSPSRPPALVANWSPGRVEDQGKGRFSEECDLSRIDAITSLPANTTRVREVILCADNLASIDLD
jgi:hypothetical protein